MYKLLRYKVNLMLTRDGHDYNEVILLYNRCGDDRDIFIDVFTKSENEYITSYVVVTDIFGDIGIYESYLPLEPFNELSFDELEFDFEDEDSNVNLSFETDEDFTNYCLRTYGNLFKKDNAD